MDEITNAILTNPELLARAQGRDIKITDNYTNAKGQEGTIETVQTEI